MFAAVIDWLLPISVGLFAGLLISTRKKIDPRHLVTLEADDFRLNMRKGQLIDIRKDGDFKNRKINGSRNFPGRSVFTQLHKLRKDQAIFLVGYEKSLQNRSIARKLVKKGFHPVYTLKGGIENWPFNLKEEQND